MAKTKSVQGEKSKRNTISSQISPARASGLLSSKSVGRVLGASEKMRKRKKTCPELYKTRHNIGKRSAAGGVASYRESEVALLFQDGFFRPTGKGEQDKPAKRELKGEDSDNVNPTAVGVIQMNNKKEYFKGRKETNKYPSDTVKKLNAKLPTESHADKKQSLQSQSISFQSLPESHLKTSAKKYRTSQKNLSIEKSVGTGAKKNEKTKIKLNKASDKHLSVKEPNKNCLRDQCKENSLSLIMQSASKESKNIKPKMTIVQKRKDYDFKKDKNLVKKSRGALKTNKVVATIKSKFVGLPPRAPRIKRTACLNAGAIMSAMYQDEPVIKKPKVELFSSQSDSDKSSCSTSKGAKGSKKQNKTDMDYKPGNLKKTGNLNKMKSKPKLCRERKAVHLNVGKKVKVKMKAKEKMKRKTKVLKKSKSIKPPESSTNSSESESEEEHVPLWPPPRRMASLNAQAILAVCAEERKRQKSYCLKSQKKLQNKELQLHNTSVDLATEKMEKGGENYSKYTEGGTEDCSEKGVQSKTPEIDVYQFVPSPEPPTTQSVRMAPIRAINRTVTESVSVPAVPIKASLPTQSPDIQILEVKPPSFSATPVSRLDAGNYQGHSVLQSRLNHGSLPFMPSSSSSFNYAAVSGHSSSQSRYPGPPVQQAVPPHPGSYPMQHQVQGGYQQPHISYHSQAQSHGSMQTENQHSTHKIYSHHQSGAPHPQAQQHMGQYVSHQQPPHRLPMPLPGQLQAPFQQQQQGHHHMMASYQSSLTPQSSQTSGVSPHTQSYHHQNYAMTQGHNRTLMSGSGHHSLTPGVYPSSPPGAPPGPSSQLSKPKLEPPCSVSSQRFQTIGPKPEKLLSNYSSMTGAHGNTSQHGSNNQPHGPSPMGNTCTYPYPHSNHGNNSQSGHCQSYMMNSMPVDNSASYTMMSFRHLGNAAFALHSFDEQQQDHGHATFGFYQPAGPLIQAHDQCCMPEHMAMIVPRPQVKVLVHNAGSYPPSNPYGPLTDTSDAGIIPVKPADIDLAQVSTPQLKDKPRSSMSTLKQKETKDGKLQEVLVESKETDGKVFATLEVATKKPKNMGGRELLAERTKLTSEPLLLKPVDSTMITDCANKKETAVHKPPATSESRLHETTDIDTTVLVSDETISADPTAIRYKSTDNSNSKKDDPKSRGKENDVLVSTIPSVTTASTADKADNIAVEISTISATSTRKEHMNRTKSEEIVAYKCPQTNSDVTRQSTAHALSMLTSIAPVIKKPSTPSKLQKCVKKNEDMAQTDDFQHGCCVVTDTTVTMASKGTLTEHKNNSRKRKNVTAKESRTKHIISTSQATVCASSITDDSGGKSKTSAKAPFGMKSSTRLMIPFSNSTTTSVTPAFATIIETTPSSTSSNITIFSDKPSPVMSSDLMESSTKNESVLGSMSHSVNTPISLAKSTSEINLVSKALCATNSSDLLKIPTNGQQPTNISTGNDQIIIAKPSTKSSTLTSRSDATRQTASFNLGQTAIEFQLAKSSDALRSKVHSSPSLPSNMLATKMSLPKENSSSTKIKTATNCTEIIVTNTKAVTTVASSSSLLSNAVSASQIGEVCQKSISSGTAVPTIIPQGSVQLSNAGILNQPMIMSTITNQSPVVSGHMPVVSMPSGQIVMPVFLPAKNRTSVAVSSAVSAATVANTVLPSNLAAQTRLSHAQIPVSHNNVAFSGIMPPVFLSIPQPNSMGQTFLQFGGHHPNLQQIRVPITSHQKIVPRMSKKATTAASVQSQTKISISELNSSNANITGIATTDSQNVSDKKDMKTSKKSVKKKIQPRDDLNGEITSDNMRAKTVGSEKGKKMSDTGVLRGQSTNLPVISTTKSATLLSPYACISPQARSSTAPLSITRTQSLNQLETITTKGVDFLKSQSPLEMLQTVAHKIQHMELQAKGVNLSAQSILSNVPASRSASAGCAERLSVRLVDHNEVHDHVVANSASSKTLTAARASMHLTAKSKSNQGDQGWSLSENTVTPDVRQQQPILVNTPPISSSLQPLPVEAEKSENPESCYEDLIQDLSMPRQPAILTIAKSCGAKEIGSRSDPVTPIDLRKSKAVKKTPSISRKENAKKYSNYAPKQTMTNIMPPVAASSTGIVTKPIPVSQGLSTETAAAGCPFLAGMDVTDKNVSSSVPPAKTPHPTDVADIAKIVAKMDDETKFKPLRAIADQVRCDLESVDKNNEKTAMMKNVRGLQLNEVVQRLHQANKDTSDHSDTDTESSGIPFRPECSESSSVKVVLSISLNSGQPNVPSVVNPTNIEKSIGEPTSQDDSEDEDALFIDMDCDPSQNQPGETLDNAKDRNLTSNNLKCGHKNDGVEIGSTGNWTEIPLEQKEDFISSNGQPDDLEINVPICSEDLSTGASRLSQHLGDKENNVCSSNVKNIGDISHEKNKNVVGCIYDKISSDCCEEISGDVGDNIQDLKVKEIVTAIDNIVNAGTGGLQTQPQNADRQIEQFTNEPPDMSVKSTTVTLSKDEDNISKDLRLIDLSEGRAKSDENNILQLQNKHYSEMNFAHDQNVLVPVDQLKEPISRGQTSDIKILKNLNTAVNEDIGKNLKGIIGAGFSQIADSTVQPDADVGNENLIPMYTQQAIGETSELQSSVPDKRDQGTIFYTKIEQDQSRNVDGKRMEELDSMPNEDIPQILPIAVVEDAVISHSANVLSQNDDMPFDAHSSVSAEGSGHRDVLHNVGNVDIAQTVEEAVMKDNSNSINILDNTVQQAIMADTLYSKASSGSLGVIEHVPDLTDKEFSGICGDGELSEYSYAEPLEKALQTGQMWESNILNSTKANPGSSETIPSLSEDNLPETIPGPSDSAAIAGQVESIHSLFVAIPRLSHAIPDSFKAMPGSLNSIPSLPETTSGPPEAIPSLSETIKGCFESMPGLTEAVPSTSVALPELSKAFLLPPKNESMTFELRKSYNDESASFGQDSLNEHYSKCLQFAHQQEQRGCLSPKSANPNIRCSSSPNSTELPDILEEGSDRMSLGKNVGNGNGKRSGEDNPRRTSPRVQAPKKDELVIDTDATPRKASSGNKRKDESPNGSPPAKRALVSPKRRDDKKAGGDVKKASPSAKKKEEKPYKPWRWEGPAQIMPVYTQVEGPPVPMMCYPAMRHDDGDLIRVRDCVLVKSGPRKSDVPYVAKIGALFENCETKEMLMSVLWYYRAEHTETDRLPQYVDGEIFASKHRDIIPAVCIDDKCYVLTFNEFCRYRREQKKAHQGIFASNAVVPTLDPTVIPSQSDHVPPLGISAETVFLCRRVYDVKLKRVLKNPQVHVPPHLG